jgi:hypothetical protein
MKCRATLGLLLLAFGAAGCGGTKPVPPATDLASARLTITNMTPGAKPLCDVTLTAPADVAEVLAWLNAVDWSQRGQDLTVVGMPSPDGSFLLKTTGGDYLDFHFYWDGKVVDGRGNRLVTGGDTTKLRQIVQKHCKNP